MKAIAFAVTLFGLVGGWTGHVAAQAAAAKEFAYLTANRVNCGLNFLGGLCVDVSSIIGGGLWPAGTADQYIFTSGIQVAGIIPPTAGGGRPAFAWAGDTVGAYFEDLNGTTDHAEGLTGLFDSRDTADIAIWPNAAVVRDSAIFGGAYLGTKVVSGQEIWTRYWDGSPRRLSDRTHPMGIAVDQRAMVWDYPGGNADIVYFVFTLYNVSARNAATYPNATIPPEVQGEIAALGTRFQDSSEAQLGIAIPDAGYAVDSLYLGLQMDPDISPAARLNYATAILPFGAALAYKSSFVEPSWTFPPEIYGAPPFTPAPGFVGAVFPRRPASIAMFSNLGGGGSFPPPAGVPQLWRYLSGNFNPAVDNPCNRPGVPKERGVCFVYQSPLDVRFMLSLGPFALAPGEAKTVVLAYLFAAPLDTVSAYAGGDVKPGFPFTGDSIAADSSRINVIERAAGWVTQRDANANGTIEAAEVTTARRSLLHKAQVAQAFVDNKFVVPTGPEAPSFFLVPGDNEVTIVWRPSATESTGDPYFAIAADATSPLYDPNYRRFDVEGYRIYRGRDPRTLEVIAQVDHDRTDFVDYLGAVAYPGRCAPDLGITDDCPVPFPPVPDTAVHHSVALAGRVVQVAEGGRIQSTSGLLTAVKADTFPAGGAGGFPPLSDGGVTYTFTDRGARNSFRYYYAVTVFDFNSIRSGPSSFESSRVAKAVTPRASSGQETAGGVQPMRLLAADGTTLNPLAPLPSLDPATGIFSGPMPPADGLAVALEAFLPQLLADDSLVVRVDSIVPGNALAPGTLAPGRPTTYYLRVTGAGVSDTFSLAVPFDLFNRDAEEQVRFRAVAASDSQAQRFGGDSTYAFTATASITLPGVWRIASWGRGAANSDPVNSSHNGPRWWAGTQNENTAGPNELVCTPAIGTCIQPDLTRNAGTLPGVDTLFHLQAYSTVPSVPMRELEGIGASVYRAADMRVYWGVAGAIDSVVDLTHRVRVPFSPRIRASWGILTDSSFALGGTNQATTGDGNNALLTWSDAFCVDPVPAYQNQCGGAAQNPALLQNHARLSPVSARSTTYAATASLPQTGQGFIFYLNGRFFLMQLAALPAAGTVWNVRFYAGTVTGTRAQGDYALQSAFRPPAVPGLRAEISYRGSRFSPLGTTDSLLARVHTVPDPFYVASGYDLSPDTLALKFVHLPAQAIIRIYSASGILVAILIHNDPTGGGEATWDLRSRTGRRVASGVYFYHVETPDRRGRLGRFTVVTGPRRR